MVHGTAYICKEEALYLENAAPSSSAVYDSIMRGRLGDLIARTHTPFYLAIEVEVKVQVQDMGKGVEGDAPCSGL